MRQLSLDGIRSLLAQETADVWVCALEIYDPEDSRKVTRVCANNEYVTHGGNLYTPVDIQITLAQDNEDSMPQAKVKVDNIWGDMTMAIRMTNKSPRIDVHIFRIPINASRSPEGYVAANLEISSTFTLLSATVNESYFEGTLGVNNDFLNEPSLHARFTPTLCPGMF